MVYIRLQYQLLIQSECIATGLLKVDTVRSLDRMTVCRHFKYMHKYEYIAKMYILLVKYLTRNAFVAL